MSKNSIKAVIGGKTFELRHLSVAENLSEETTAFSADIYIDGVRAGYVRNSGHGGGNYPTVLPGARGIYDAVAEETAKHHYHSVAHNGRVFDWDYDMDFLIGMMVEAAWYDDKETYTL